MLVTFVTSKVERSMSLRLVASNMDHIDVAELVTQPCTLMLWSAEQPENV